MKKRKNTKEREQKLVADEEWEIGKQVKISAFSKCDRRSTSSKESSGEYKIYFRSLHTRPMNKLRTNIKAMRDPSLKTFVINFKQTLVGPVRKNPVSNRKEEHKKEERMK